MSPYQFLQQFYKDGETIHLRILKDKGKKYPKNLTTTLEDIQKDKAVGEKNEVYSLSKLNSEGYGLFFVVNPGGTKNADIEAINAYFVDFDAGKETFSFDSLVALKTKRDGLEETGQFSEFEEKRDDRSGKWILTGVYSKRIIDEKKKSFLKKNAHLLKGTLIVETYSGYHIYFLLKERENPSSFSKIQEALANVLDGDKSVKNPARVLRLPGYRHNKYAQNPLIEVVSSSIERFTLEDIKTRFSYQNEPSKGVKEEVSLQMDYAGRVAKVTNKTFVQTDLVWKSAQKKKNEQMNLREFTDYIKELPFSEFIEDIEENKMFSCHFHSDASPSANITNMGDGYFYNCFGCRTAGNIIKIYQISNNTTWKEAIKELSNILGIKLVAEEWQMFEYEKNIQNFAYLRKMMDDKRKNEVEYATLLKLLTPKRLDILRYFIELSLLHTMKEEWLDKDGNAIFFASVPSVSRATDNLRSIIATWRNLKMLQLLGFIKRVNPKDVPEELSKRAKQEQTKTKAILERKFKKEGQNIEIDVQEISFWIVPLFEEIEEVALIRADSLRQHKFSVKVHMNKNDLTLLFGEELANELYPDDRNSSKHEKVYEKFEKLVLDAITEKGYCIDDEILNIRIYKDKNTKYSASQREKLFKRFLPTILQRNDLSMQTIRSNRKKEELGYKGNKTTIKMIHREDLS